MVSKKKIGRYQIEREVDIGVRLQAYHAFDPDSGRNVTLECVSQPGIDDEVAEQVRQLLLDKARQACTLRHERIAATYEAVVDEGQVWVAWEPVKGESLENLLSTSDAVSKDLIRNILYHTAHCLDYAHKLGVRHGRLSPAEILVQEDGALKILGFWRPSVSSSGDVSAFDRTHYSSPEEIRGLALVPASDQYSLAAIAHELLTGVTPFQGDAIGVRNRIVLDSPPDPSALNPSIGEDAALVLLRAMEKAPEARFASCFDFVQALDEALQAPPGWAIPAEYRGSAPGPMPQMKLSHFEGDVTETLLREVLRERPVEAGPLERLRKYAKPAGIAAAAVVALVLVLSWAMTPGPPDNPAQPLTADGWAPPPAVIDQPYAFTLQAAGGQPPYEWSIVEGELPKGIELNPQGVLRGQSGAAGIYRLHVQVKDGASGEAVTQPLSLTVRSGPSMRSPGTLAVATVGREYSHSLGVTGGQRPYRWAVAGGDVPPGLTLNPFNGFLEGRPEAAGAFQFSISVSDLFGATSTRQFELQVKPAAGDDTAADRVANVADAASPQP